MKLPHDSLPGTLLAGGTLTLALYLLVELLVARPI